MNDYLKTHPILLEAYEHYEATGNRHFIVIPKNPDYLVNVLNTISTLQDDGYITNVSDNLLNDNSISLVPTETGSFDITVNGIEYVGFYMNS